MKFDRAMLEELQLDSSFTPIHSNLSPFRRGSSGIHPKSPTQDPFLKSILNQRGVKTFARRMARSHDVWASLISRRVRVVITTL